MWCDFDVYGPSSFFGVFRNARGVHAMQHIKNFKTRALRFNNSGLNPTNIDREIGGQSYGQISAFILFLVKLHDAKETLIFHLLESLRSHLYLQ